MEWEEFKKELLKDPEFKKEYEKLEPEYKIIRQILALRRKVDLYTGFPCKKLPW